MNGENGQMVQSQIEVIAMPPLQMVLVRAQEERENALSAVIKSAVPQEKVEPQALKKLIAHLEQRS